MFGINGGFVFVFLKQYAYNKLSTMIVAENDEEKMKPYSDWKGMYFALLFA